MSNNNLSFFLYYFNVYCANLVIFYLIAKNHDSDSYFIIPFLCSFILSVQR